MSLHLSELCCPDKQIGTRKLTLTNRTKSHAVNRRSQAAADGPIAQEGGADGVESGRPAFFLYRSCLSPALPHGLPALSTLPHTAGIRPINRQTTSCVARRLLTLHDQGGGSAGGEGEAGFQIKERSKTIATSLAKRCNCLFFFISREGRPENTRSGARDSGRKLLQWVSED